MTGLVYVAIVALWAAVLIPMWLRRHDDDQARRVDRHRNAMGTLATMSTPRGSATSHVARRRRMIAALLVLPGAITVGAWVAGLAPTVLVVVAFVPLVSYVVLVTVTGRRARAQEAATARRSARDTRDRSRRVQAPIPDTTSAPASPPKASLDEPPAWEDVFDQTA